MKEIRYSAKIQEQQTLSDAKGVGPDIDKLKDKFKEGSIPLQTDFNQLIDIADIGRKATGQAPNQNGPAKGMRLGEDGLLQLKLDEKYAHANYSPLRLHDDALVVGVGNGLINFKKSNEIGVNDGNGIRIDDNKVAVELADNKGLVVDSNGIAIKPGNGVKFSSDGALTVNSADSTIKVDGSGIKVATGWGVKVGGEGLDVNVRTDGGIGNDSSGIYVKTGNGIKLDNDQVAVELADNKGLVVDSNGIAIKPGDGMQFSSDGALQLKLNKNYADRFYSPLILRNDVLAVGISHGLTTYQGSYAIGVNPGNGLRINDDSVAVKLADNKGLVVDSNGISIKPGNGIKVDADGVAIDPNTVLPRGMIMMFSGNSVPEGWAICDGYNNTPDFLNRSIEGNTRNIKSKNGIDMTIQYTAIYIMKL
ncbi:tail fiber protein [Xenorhabdus khoisanae]|uniref:tail fiber protein n=1 Tax=Xenorhabdus khoisanae TaxID=880157 RepID=UPI00069EBB12|nr:tail fiber protein [Xenorhabdus khoisanae]